MPMITRNHPKKSISESAPLVSGVVKNSQAAVAMRGWVLAYIAGITIMELASVAAGAGVAAALAALLIILLVNHYFRADQSSGREILAVLVIAPLIRLTSIAIPLADLPPLYRFVVVGIPILVAELFFILHNYLPDRIGFSLTGLRRQAGRHLLIQFTVPIFSFIGYLQVRPAPLVDENAGWQQIVIVVIVLFLFVGFVEEVFYRGLLLPAAEKVFGRSGLFISALVYVVMYVGTFAWGYILMMAVVGIFFGWHAKRTNSLWGVTIAHSLMMAGILIYWPLI